MTFSIKSVSRASSGGSLFLQRPLRLEGESPWTQGATLQADSKSGSRSPRCNTPSEGQKRQFSEVP